MLNVGANNLKQAFSFRVNERVSLISCHSLQLSAVAKFSEFRIWNPAWKALRGVDISALSNYSDQKLFQADSALHHAEWSLKLITVLSSDNGLVAAEKLRDNIALFSLLFLEFVDIFFQEHIELKQLFVT